MSQLHSGKDHISKYYFEGPILRDEGWVIRKFGPIYKLYEYNYGPEIFVTQSEDLSSLHQIARTLT